MDVEHTPAVHVGLLDMKAAVLREHKERRAEKRVRRNAARGTKCLSTPMGEVACAESG